MKRNKEQLEQVQEIVLSYLNKTNNDPYMAYDEYIKYYLTSGQPLPSCIKGIDDFIKYSKPKTNKTKTARRSASVEQSYNMSVEDIITELKDSIELYEQMQKDYQNKNKIEDAKSCWTSLQSYKIMLCKITGQEYECVNIP